MTFDESTVRRAHGRFTDKENSEVDAAVLAHFTDVQLAGAPVPALTLSEAFAPRGVTAARRIDAWLATAELVEE